MHFKQLATDITVFLAPFLPYLILAGEATAEKIGEKFGITAVEKAKSVWDKMQNFTQDDTKFKGITTALAEDPDDDDFQVALVKLLIKQFKANPRLADELTKIIKDDKVIQSVIIERESKAENISQRLNKKSGTQEVKVREKSEVGNINQEM